MIRQYLEYRRTRREIDRWLQASNPAHLAARAMWRLNRYARQYNYRRYAIYALKRRLVELWYHDGRARAVSAQIQTMYCWGCQGSGEYWDGDICHKCWGSGVYREHTLYRFIFDVAGRRYIWHQPEDLVEFDVQLLDEPPGSYRPPLPDNEDVWMPRPEVIFWQMVLCSYLEARTGEWMMASPTLRDALAHDVRWALRRRPVGARLIYWWDGVRRNRRALGIMDEGEIPF